MRKLLSFVTALPNAIFKLFNSKLVYNCIFLFRVALITLTLNLVILTYLEIENQLDIFRNWSYTQTVSLLNSYGYDLKMISEIQSAYASESPTQARDRCIVQAANKYSVHENVIRAQMHVESGSDSDALSHKNAMGLMQVTPKWAKSLGYSKADMFDVCKNIDAGTAHIAYSMRFAYMDYNGGPKAIRTILNCSNSNDFTDACLGGYTETRDYVKKVQNTLTQLAQATTENPL